MGRGRPARAEGDAVILGPGTRVWIAWTPDHQCQGRGSTRARCRQGLVLDGPFRPFTLYDTRTGEFLTDTRCAVRVHGLGETVFFISASLLWPIDDDSDAATTRERTPVEIDA